jgi:hypothetical protein
MDVKTSAVASCTLRELIDAVEPRPYGHALSDYQECVLDCFGGKPGALHLGSHPRLALLINENILSPKLGSVQFHHAELFLRFSRLENSMQDSFLYDLCCLMGEKNIDKLEIEVQWSVHKTRRIKAERVTYDSITGDRFQLVLAMV